MKGQSLIIQYLLFFMIGFSVFIFIGSFFRYQSDLFRTDIINSNLKTANSYLSTAAIVAVDSCNQCDSAAFSLKVQNQTAGYDIVFNLFTLSGLTTSVNPLGKWYVSPLHNLNSSYILNGTVSSSKPITLTFTRTNNTLGIS